MPDTIKEFDSMKIKDGSFQFGASDVVPVKCLGSIEGETEMREIVKRCEGVVVKRKVTPIAHTFTLAGHMPVSVLRKIPGLSNVELKAGVYSYGMNSKAAEFVLTANVIDDFEEVKKLVAYPRATSNSGLTYTIDNDADEVAYVEMEMQALMDELGNFYYEAFESEIDEAIKTAWHTNFTKELVSLPSV